MRKAVIAALGLGTTVAGVVVADRRVLAKWATNPDPLNGRPVVFPDGETRIVETDDGARITTRRAGAGPLAVLVHGVTANMDDWGPVAERLIEDGWSVLGVEQRGHGESTVGTAGYGSERLGRDLAAVFETLDLSDVVLVGHSMGGMAAMSMLVDRPDLQPRLKRLVLVATAASMGDALHQISLRLGGRKFTDLADRFGKRLRLGAGLSVFGAAPSLHMVDEVLRQFEACPDDVRREATAALVHHDVTDRLHTISVPTHVVAGTRDLLTPLEGNELLAREIPDASITIHEGAGHMIIWEHPSEIAQTISNFHA